MSQLPVVRSKSFPLRVIASSEVLREEWLGDADQWATRVVTEFAITKRNILHRLFLFRLLMLQEEWVRLIRGLVEVRLLNKKKLLELYHLQTPDIQSRQTILFLADLASIKHAGIALFTSEEIASLASSATSIGDRDLNFIVGKSEVLEKIPPPVLLQWGDQNRQLSVRNRALLIQRVFSLNRALVPVEMLSSGLYEAAHIAPQSGAVQVYFTMLYSVEGVRSRKGRDKARETFADVIGKMICPTVVHASVDFFGAQNLLGWYLTNPMISQVDKDWVEEQIAPHVKAYGNKYLSFIEDAKSKSAFAIR